MLVDDESDISEVIKKGLERARFVVAAFCNPLDALSSFREGQYDMLILDVKMPQMDGFTLYERMREIDRSVKVCFLTAFDIEYQEEFRRKFPHLDVKCFMKKPISIMTVIKMVRAELSLA